MAETKIKTGNIYSNTNPYEYELPIASESTLGGVKPSNRDFTIQPDGVLTVNPKVGEYTAGEGITIDERKEISVNLDKELSTLSTDETVPTSKATYTAASRISDNLLRKLHFNDVGEEILYKDLEVKTAPNPSKEQEVTSWVEYPKYIDGIKAMNDEDWYGTKTRFDGAANKILVPYPWFGDPAFNGIKIKRILISTPYHKAPATIQLIKLKANDKINTDTAESFLTPDRILQTFEVPSGDLIELNLKEPYEITENNKLGIVARNEGRLQGYFWNVYPTDLKYKCLTVYANNNYDAQSVVALPITIDVLKQEQAIVDVDNFPPETILDTQKVQLQTKEVHETILTNIADTLTGQTQNEATTTAQWGPYRFQSDKPFIDLAKEGKIKAIEFVANPAENGKEVLVYKIPLATHNPKSIADPIETKYPVIGRQQYKKGIMHFDFDEPVDTSVDAIWVSSVHCTKHESADSYFNLYGWINGTGAAAGPNTSYGIVPIRFFCDKVSIEPIPEQDITFNTPHLNKATDKIEFYYDFNYVDEDTPLDFEVRAYNEKTKLARYGKLKLTANELKNTAGIIKTGLTFTANNLYNLDRLAIKQEQKIIKINGIAVELKESAWSDEILIEDSSLPNPSDPLADINLTLSKINVQEKVAKLEETIDKNIKTYRIPLDNRFEEINISLLDNGAYTIMADGQLVNNVGTTITVYKGDLLTINKEAGNGKLFNKNGLVTLGFSDVEYLPSTDKKWEGKVWACVGDSLTEVNSRTTKHYFDYIAEKTGIKTLNFGRSGTGYVQPYSYEPFYERVKTIPTDVDVITIFGSFNDMGGSIPMGTENDSGTETFGGCMNTTLENLYAHNPKAIVGIVSPSPWKSYNPHTKNSKGEQYVALLEKVAARWSIPYLDLYHCAGFRAWDNTFLKLYFKKDWNGDSCNGMHPDEDGHKLMAPRFEAFLDTLIIK